MLANTDSYSSLEKRFLTPTRNLGVRINSPVVRVLVHLEAPPTRQSRGTPAVVTSASSGPEEVGDAGVTVPPRDPEALALAIRR